MGAVSKRLCTISGCASAYLAKGMCQKHYLRVWRHGSPEVTKRRSNGSGHFSSSGYLLRTVDGRRRLAHVLIVEKAIGGTLPKGTHIHHVNGDGTDNRPENLVVCPDAAYHKLLHQRQRALDACGNANWFRCSYCRSYDDTAHLRAATVLGKVKFHYHLSCAAAYQRARTRRS